MTIAGFWLTFIVGCLGGIMGEALHWYQRRSSPRMPAYLRGARYWVSTAVMVVIGGLLATLYGIEEKSATLVVHIGLTAPLIIKSLAQVVPPETARSLDADPSILDFLAAR